MALPVLNDTPKYELEIPSTGERVRFRPYLVKEEKILMLAAESQDSNQMMNAILDTIQACVQSDLKVRSLTTFDLEYLFIKLRSKSVGEKISLNLKCQSCEHENEYVMDLEQITCGQVKPRSNVIELDDKISVVMRYPSYIDFQDIKEEGEMGFNILANSLDAVITEDERIDIADEAPESVRRFLESMTREQFEKITKFLFDIPKVSYDLDFDCNKCGEHTHLELRGIQDFF